MKASSARMQVARMDTLIGAKTVENNIGILNIGVSTEKPIENKEQEINANTMLHIERRSESETENGSGKTLKDAEPNLIADELELPIFQPI